MKVEGFKSDNESIPRGYEAGRELVIFTSSHLPLKTFTLIPATDNHYSTVSPTLSLPWYFSCFLFGDPCQRTYEGNTLIQISSSRKVLQSVAAWGANWLVGNKEFANFPNVCTPSKFLLSVRLIKRWVTRRFLQSKKLGFASARWKCISQEPELVLCLYPLPHLSYTSISRFPPSPMLWNMISLSYFHTSPLRTYARAREGKSMSGNLC